MLDGRPLIDVHLHPARLDQLKLSWDVWVQDFGSPELEAMYVDDVIDPAAFDRYLAGEGVDIALLLSEYSPKVTGTQAVEDMAAIAAQSPDRIRFAANVNPHLHYPVDVELERQLALGAVALKVHPVHGGFAVNDPALYPAYAICQARGIPLVVHTGTSTFPGALNRFGDPALVDDVLRDFRALDIVLAHGGRGWSYDVAAVLALTNDRVWLELSGLPPSRLQTYYARHNWDRLCRRMIFGTDWPGTPGIAKNARAVAALCPDDSTAGLVLAGNAMQVYRFSSAALD
jgi:predicted TIM-barrel fold metal-dependent hydrolase